MHTTKITAADRAALENLWGPAGSWVVETWTRLNAEHFGGALRYHGVVWGLTPHGHRLGHTSNAGGRITLHPALLDPQGNAWKSADELGTRYAADVLLHEMIHVLLLDNQEVPDHNTDEWCAEIVRITPALGLRKIMAAPVRPRRVDGKVVRLPRDGHLPRGDIARWPLSIRPASYYAGPGNDRIQVPI